LRSNTSTSARDVVREASDHEIVVLVAHGQVEALDDAAILCLDASGNIDRLDVTQLGRAPDSFAGATRQPGCRPAVEGRAVLLQVNELEPLRHHARLPRLHRAAVADRMFEIDQQARIR
jgi:hypothetical protein